MKCIKCKKNKPLKQFSKHAYKPGLRKTCKDCDKKYGEKRDWLKIIIG